MEVLKLSDIAKELFKFNFNLDLDYELQNLDCFEDLKNIFLKEFPILEKNLLFFDDFFRRLDFFSQKFLFSSDNNYIRLFNSFISTFDKKIDLFYENLYNRALEPDKNSENFHKIPKNLDLKALQIILKEKIIKISNEIHELLIEKRELSNPEEFSMSIEKIIKFNEFLRMSENSLISRLKINTGLFLQNICTNKKLDFPDYLFIDWNKLNLWINDNSFNSKRFPIYLSRENFLIQSLHKIITENLNENWQNIDFNAVSRAVFHREKRIIYKEIVDQVKLKFDEGKFNENSEEFAKKTENLIQENQNIRFLAQTIIENPLYIDIVRNKININTIRFLEKTEENEDFLLKLEKISQEYSNFLHQIKDFFEKILFFSKDEQLFYKSKYFQILNQIIETNLENLNKQTLEEFMNSLFRNLERIIKKEFDTVGQNRIADALMGEFQKNNRNNYLGESIRIIHELENNKPLEGIKKMKSNAENDKNLKEKAALLEETVKTVYPDKKNQSSSLKKMGTLQLKEEFLNKSKNINFNEESPRILGNPPKIDNFKINLEKNELKNNNINKKLNYNDEEDNDFDKNKKRMEKKDDQNLKNKEKKTNFLNAHLEESELIIEKKEDSYLNNKDKKNFMLNAHLADSVISFEKKDKNYDEDLHPKKKQEKNIKEDSYSFSNQNSEKKIKEDTDSFFNKNYDDLHANKKIRKNNDDQFLKKNYEENLISKNNFEDNYNENIKDTVQADYSEKNKKNYKFELENTVEVNYEQKFENKNLRRDNTIQVDYEEKSKKHSKFDKQQTIEVTHEQKIKNDNLRLSLIKEEISPELLETQYNKLQNFNKNFQEKNNFEFHEEISNKNSKENENSSRNKDKLFDFDDLNSNKKNNASDRFGLSEPKSFKNQEKAEDKYRKFDKNYEENDKFEFDDEKSNKKSNEDEISSRKKDKFGFEDERLNKNIEKIDKFGQQEQKSFKTTLNNKGKSEISNQNLDFDQKSEKLIFQESPSSDINIERNIIPSSKKLTLDDQIIENSTKMPQKLERSVFSIKDKQMEFSKKQEIEDKKEVFSVEEFQKSELIIEKSSKMEDFSRIPKNPSLKLMPLADSGKKIGSQTNFIEPKIDSKTSLKLEELEKKDGNNMFWDDNEDILKEEPINFLKKEIVSETIINKIVTSDKKIDLKNSPKNILQKNQIDEDLEIHDLGFSPQILDEGDDNFFKKKPGKIQLKDNKMNEKFKKKNEELDFGLSPELLDEEEDNYFKKKSTENIKIKEEKKDISKKMPEIKKNNDFSPELEEDNDFFDKIPNNKQKNDLKNMNNEKSEKSSKIDFDDDNVLDDLLGSNDFSKNKKADLIKKEEKKVIEKEDSYEYEFDEYVESAKNSPLKKSEKSDKSNPKKSHYSKPSGSGLAEKSEQKKIINLNDLKLINKYIDETGLKGEMEWADFNRYEVSNWIVEEFLHQGKVFIYDIEESSLIMSLVSSLEKNNKLGKEKALAKIQNEISGVEEHLQNVYNKITEQVEFGPNCKVYLLFDGQDFNLLMIEIDLFSKTLNMFYNKAVPKDAKMISKLSNLIVIIEQLFRIPNLKSNDIVIPIEIIKIIDKNLDPSLIYIKNFVILFDMLYEYPDRNENLIPKFHITNETFERLYNNLKSISLVYQILEQNGELYSQYFDKVISDNSAEGAPCMVIYEILEQETINSEEIIDFLKRILEAVLEKSQELQFIVMCLEIDLIKTEERNAFYLYIENQTEESPKFLIQIFYLDSYDHNLSKIVIDTLEIELKKPEIITEIYFDFPRHNTIFDNSIICAGTWSNMILDRKKSALEAFKLITYSLIPVYIETMPFLEIMGREEEGSGEEGIEEMEGDEFEEINEEVE